MPRGARRLLHRTPDSRGGPVDSVLHYVVNVWQKTVSRVGHLAGPALPAGYVRRGGGPKNPPQPSPEANTNFEHFSSLLPPVRLIPLCTWSMTTVYFFCIVARIGTTFIFSRDRGGTRFSAALSTSRFTRVQHRRWCGKMRVLRNVSFKNVLLLRTISSAFVCLLLFQQTAAEVRSAQRSSGQERGGEAAGRPFPPGNVHHRGREGARRDSLGTWESVVVDVSSHLPASQVDDDAVCLLLLRSSAVVVAVLPACRDLLLYRGCECSTATPRVAGSLLKFPFTMYGVDSANSCSNVCLCIYSCLVWSWSSSLSKVPRDVCSV